jgi:hypothetical protein
MSFRARTWACLASTAALVAACSGGGAADFSGDYTITASNGTNDCQIANWDTAQPATGITVTITQDPTNLAVAQLTFTGLWALYFDVVEGTHIFSGARVNGDQLDVTVLGTKTVTPQGTSCGYTVNAHLQLTLTGNTVNGSIQYKPVTNGDPSCGVLNACSNSQTISGSRPGK